MKPVTDPDLLAQLSAPQRAEVPTTQRVWGDREAEAAGIYETPQRGSMRPVSDPDILAQLNGQGGTGGEENGANVRPPVPAVGMEDTSAPKGNITIRPYNTNAPEPSPMLPGVARSFIGQGLAAGFGDEIEAFARSRFNGSSYDDELKSVREELKKFQDENPVTSTVAEMGGAVATSLIPGMAAARGAGLAANSVRGAVSGAAYGGAYGVGTGEDAESRTKQGATGFITGGAVGAAAPYIGSLAGKAASGAKELGSRALAPIRAITDAGADREAARRVGQAASIDMASARPGLAANEFAEAQARGQPVTNLERGGEMTRALADSAATTSPTARAVLGRAIDDRVESQGWRTTEFLRDLARTPGNASATREGLMKAAEKSRAGYYQKAYHDGRNGVWSDDLANMSRAPAMEAAQKAAVESIRNKQASGRSVGALSPDGVPTLEFWDQVKRNLDSHYKILIKHGNDEAAADILSMKKELVARLDQAVPSYANARGVSAAFFGADDALEAGEKFVLSSHKLSDATRALGKMTPEERDLFREGFISSLVEKVERTGDRRNIVNGIWNSKEARDKILLVLGPQKSRELEAFMRVETLMNTSRSVLGGSPTARRMTELGLAGGTYGISTGGNVLNPDPSAVGNAALVYALTRGKFRIDNKIATKVAEKLVSDNPKAFQQGIKIISNSHMLNALRHASGPVAAIAGQQAVSQTGN